MHTFSEYKFIIKSFLLRHKIVEIWHSQIEPDVCVISTFKLTAYIYFRFALKRSETKWSYILHQKKYNQWYDSIEYSPNSMLNCDVVFLEIPHTDDKYVLTRNPHYFNSIYACNNNRGSKIKRGNYEGYRIQGWMMATIIDMLRDYEKNKDDSISQKK